MFMDKQFKKTVPIFLLIAAILSPMTLYIYIYDRDLLVDLDFAKILLLVIVIGILILFLSYLLSFFRTSLLIFSINDLNVVLKSYEKELDDAIDEIQLKDEKVAEIIKNKDKFKSLESRDDPKLKGLLAERDANIIRLINVNEELSQSISEAESKISGIKSEIEELSSEIFNLQVTAALLFPIVISIVILVLNVPYLFGLNQYSAEPIVILKMLSLLFIGFLVFTIYCDRYTKVESKKIIDLSYIVRIIIIELIVCFLI